jgi:hypothetical protein
VNGKSWLGSGVPATITKVRNPPVLLAFFLLFRRGLYYQDRTVGVPDHGFGGRAKDNSADSGSSVRRNHNQINVPLFGHAHNLSGGIAVHDHLVDVQATKIIAVGDLRQLSLG